MKGRLADPILSGMRFGAIVLALSLGASLASAQEGAGSLDAPPGSDAESGAPPSTASETPSTEASGDPLPMPAASPSEAIPPPPAPTAGYGTPVYPGPQTGLPGAPADDGIRLPSNVSTRLRVLDSSLQVLASRGSNRIVDGVLSMVSGGVSIGLGIWARQDGLRDLARYAFLMGSVSVTRGIIDLALSPNPQPPAIQFGHMPMRTVDEARERLRFGENALEALARRSRAVRLIDASLSIGSGIAVVPLFLHQKDYKFTEPLDYFIVIAAGIQVITGIINLATRSDAERRWSAYQDLRDRLDDEEERGSVTLAEDDGPRLMGAGISPTRGGATAGIVVGF